MIRREIRLLFILLEVESIALVVIFVEVESIVFVGVSILDGSSVGFWCFWQFLVGIWVGVFAMELRFDVLVNFELLLVEILWFLVLFVCFGRFLGWFFGWWSVLGGRGVVCELWV